MCPFDKSGSLSAAGCALPPFSLCEEELKRYPFDPKLIQMLQNLFKHLERNDSKMNKKKSSLVDKFVAECQTWLGWGGGGVGDPRCDSLQFLPSIGLFRPPCFFCSGIT